MPGVWYAFASVAVMAGAGLCLWRWLAPSIELGIGLFRPYSGLPWPRGVQEEDAVHFDLRAIGAARGDEPPDVSASPGSRPARGAAPRVPTVIEELSVGLDAAGVSPIRSRVRWGVSGPAARSTDEGPLGRPAGDGRPPGSR